MTESTSILNALVEGVTVLNVILSLFAYFLFLVTKQVITYRFFSPIKDFPGPFLGSVTRLWLAWHNAKETELASVQALHKKYGKLAI